MLKQAGFVTGGTYSGSSLRAMLWTITAGASGVSRADHLRVSAKPVPGNAIVLGPGVGFARNPLVSESYLIENDAAIEIPVPANTSSVAVIREVIITLTDPDTGQGDGTPSVQVVPSVPSGVPVLHLATLVLPGQTGTVTPAMLTDRRRMARPQQLDDYALLRPAAEVAGYGHETWVDWPPQRAGTTVPHWATRVLVKVTVIGMEFRGTVALRNGHGFLRATFNGDTSDPGTQFRAVDTTTTGVFMHVHAASFPVSSLLGGAGVQIGVQARAEYVWKLPTTGLVLVEWKFTEAPS